MKVKVLNTIRKYELIDDGDNIVIGLSGGPDSMALLHILLEIREEIDFNIFIAHVNHGVRGDEALADEEFVRNLSEDLDLPYYSRITNMDEYARAKGISSEEAGREIRYGFFREILSEIGGGKIAVGQNKDDQAETLIMRFFRGTGIDGLRGMEYKNDDIIRPILGIERLEIEEYLSSRGISSRLDRTNLEPIYNRNRIRLEMMPYIKENYNPNIVDTLWRTSEIASVDSDFLEQYARKAYENILKRDMEYGVVLDSTLFEEEHTGIQQRILRNCILDIKGNLQGLTQTHIADMLKLFLEGDTGKRIDLIDDIEARVDYEGLVVQKGPVGPMEDFVYRLDIGSNVHIVELGLEVSAEVFPSDQMDVNMKDRFIGWFDYDKIQGELYIRNRRAGDRFVPFGMKGSKKIKDYFIDEKIPAMERDRIPIITDGEDIIWVAGYRTGDLHRITSDTKNVLRISIIEKKLYET